MITQMYHPFEFEFKAPAEHWVPDENNEAKQYDLEL